MSFKECTTCGTVWETRADALSDPSLVLIGYDPDFRELKEGLFLFNHERPGCNTTLAVNAVAFTDLHDEPLFASCADSIGPCDNVCLRQDAEETCPVECDCAFVQEVTQIVQVWPKNYPEDSTLPA